MLTASRNSAEEMDFLSNKYRSSRLSQMSGVKNQFSMAGSKLESQEDSEEIKQMNSADLSVKSNHLRIGKHGMRTESSKEA